MSNSIFKTGEIIKEIRISKKLSGNYVYQDILTKPARIKFEKGLSDTTVEKFFLILDRLNVTLEEVKFWMDKEENFDFTFFQKYVKAFYQNDLRSLLTIQNELQKLYLSTKNVKHYHFKLMVEITIDKLRNTTTNQLAESELKAYLTNCERWGYYEIVLFTNTLSIFDITYINVVYKRTMQQLLQFKQIRRYKDEVIAFLLNILEITISNNDIKNAKFYYNELKTLKNFCPNNMYLFLMLDFFGEAIYILGNRNHPLNKLAYIFEMLDYYDMKRKKSQCIELLEKIKKHPIKIN